MSSPVDLHNTHYHTNTPANTAATTTATTAATTTTTTTRFVDPFVGAGKETAARRASDGSVGGPTPLAKRDRRLSKEWDAALTPPSRFQHVEGSIFATPASRDGHVQRNKIHGFKEKVLQLSGGKKSTS